MGYRQTLTYLNSLSGPVGASKTVCVWVCVTPLTVFLHRVWSYLSDEAGGGGVRGAAPVGTLTPPSPVTPANLRLHREKNDTIGYLVGELVSAKYTVYNTALE